MAGLVTRADDIHRCIIKDAVTIVEGNVVVFTATDDEVALPAGTGSLVVAGVALQGGVGVADGSVKIDVAYGGPSLPCVAAAAISAGNTVVTNSTTGKVSAGTTAGAIVGTALNNTTADAQRVWVRR